MSMFQISEKLNSRRTAFRYILGGLAATITTAAVTTEAEAKPGKGRGWGRQGNPPGWSRGRKRGWAKRGGPKWGW
jgi:hypothetical protein